MGGSFTNEENYNFVFIDPNHFAIPDSFTSHGVLEYV